jgi:hypothetical protein
MEDNRGDIQFDMGSEYRGRRVPFFLHSQIFMFVRRVSLQAKKPADLPCIKIGTF